MALNNLKHNIGAFLNTIGTGISEVFREPSTKQRPDTWTRNDTIQEITKLISSDIPTYRQISTAISMMETATPWSVRAGKTLPSFGQLLQAAKAAQINEMRQLYEIMNDDYHNEMMEQKLSFDQHRQELTSMRQLARLGHRNMRELYRNVAKIMPKLDQDEADRLMLELDRGDIDYEQSTPEDIAQHFYNSVRSAGIDYREAMERKRRK